MSGMPFITVGLLIEMEGSRYECVRDLGSQFEFSHLLTGKSESFEMVDLLEGIARQKIKVLNGKVTPNYIDINEEEAIQRSVIALSAKNERKLDIRLTYIFGIQNRGISRGQVKLLAEAAEEITTEINKHLLKDEQPYKSPSPATLNRWMSRYEKGRKEVIAVAPKYAFRSQPKRIDPQNEKFIEETFDASLFTEGKGRISTLRTDYEIRVEEFNRLRIQKGEEPILPASRSTIARRFYDIPSYDRDVAINGVQAAKVSHRVAKGHLPSEFALQYVEIDHGQLDLYVIDDLLFVPLGIPWVTIFRDRHTGIALGIYISFRKTSLQSIFGGLRHSITPHSRVAELWPDIRSYWPSGFAFTYVSDRGADFLSPRYRLAIRQLGSDVLYCETRTPWHKGPVERFIGETNRNLVESMPGRTYPFRKAPLGYNPMKQAVVRFSSLVYLIHKWIAEEYHHKAHSRKLLSPLSRWEKSITEMPIPAPPGPESFLVLTGDQHERLISHEGIVHDWLNYSSPELQEICEDLGRIKIPFISNPENKGFGMAIDPRTNQPFRVNCMAYEYANGTSQAQHQYIKRQAKIALTRDNASEVLLRTKREVQETLAEEILAKNSAEKAHLHKVAIRAGINSNAVLDGEPKSVADILKIAQGGGKPADQMAANQFVASTDVPHFSWI